MQFHRTITLKDGRPCVLRNGTYEDAARPCWTSIC